MRRITQLVPLPPNTVLSVFFGEFNEKTGGHFTKYPAVALALTQDEDDESATGQSIHALAASDLDSGCFPIDAVNFLGTFGLESTDAEIAAMAKRAFDEDEKKRAQSR